MIVLKLKFLFIALLVKVFICHTIIASEIGSTSGKNVENSVVSTTELTTLLTTTCLPNLNESLCVDENSTTLPRISSNTTQHNNLTTPDPKNGTEINEQRDISEKKNLPLKSKEVPNFTDEKICVCDLTLQFCDLNCCCDKDCSFDDRMVFTHCREIEFHYAHDDTKFCHYVRNLYVNNSYHEFKVSQDSLFCVVRSNVPQSYVVQFKDAIRTIQDAEIRKGNKQISWPVPPTMSGDNFSNMLIYGAPLWIIKNNVIQKMDYPVSFINNNDCILNQNVKYLEDVQSTCFRSDNNYENSYLFENVLFLAQPENFNATKFNKLGLKTCPKNVCLAPILHICRTFYENCTINTNKNFRFPQMSCRWNRTTYTCNNFLEKIQYLLHHNGTHGIAKIDLFVIVKNVSKVSVNRSEVRFLQTFETKFVWVNHSTLNNNYSSHLSGNPGYLIGKPILIANLVVRNTLNSNLSTSSNTTRNNSMESAIIISRDPFDFSSNFVVLPIVSDLGQCILTKARYFPLGFGYNTLIKCKVLDTIMVENKNVTASSLCQMVQKNIFQYWSLGKLTNNSLDNRVIGQFGNADPFQQDQWSPILYSDNVDQVINNTGGNLDWDKSSLTCTNISTLLTIEIYYSRLDFQIVLNQRKILATVYKFGSFQNISFALSSDKRSKIDLKVKIEMQSAFFDISAKKIRKLIDPPSLNIRLPSDFFYPFVKLNNLGCRPASTLLYLLVFICTYSLLREL